MNTGKISQSPACSCLSESSQKEERDVLRTELQEIAAGFKDVMKIRRTLSDVLRQFLFKVKIGLEILNHRT